jgi:acetyltransferase-like isoleucine patch superfamily enzyme
MIRSVTKIIRSFFYSLFFIINLIIIKLNKVRCYHITINGIVLIVNSGKIIMGNACKINSSKYNNIIGGDTRTSFVVKKGAMLIIGENVRISNSAIYCAESIIIGNHVMIGGSCKIWDTDFHPLNPTQRATNPNGSYVTRPIVIHDNVFIGGFSIVLKGTEIGENSVIGAGSVVSGTIPPNEIWAGNPAKCIKKVMK